MNLVDSNTFPPNPAIRVPPEVDAVGSGELVRDPPGAPTGSA
jgi:hypothetical protein